MPIQEFRDPDRRIRNLFWIIPIFRTLNNLETIENKLKSSRHKGSDALFSGFKLLLRVLLTAYLDYTFRDDNFLGLTENWTTRRAFFVGLPPSKIPPTSEKAIAFKNLATLFDSINQSKDFKSLKSRLDIARKRFVNPLETILLFNCTPDLRFSDRFDKNALVELEAVLQLWTWACAIDRITPLKNEWGGRALRDPAIAGIRARMDHHFVGYKIGLSWLWGALLGSKAKEFIREISKARSWEELARACNFTGREILVTLEKELGSDLATSKFFVRTENPKQTTFKELLSLSSQSDPSLRERVDEALLWYQYDVVDSARQKIFSGSSTLISLIKGELMTRKENGITDKLAVVRFKHAGSPVMFSYGVLLERFGSFSDMSGWMIFLDVGGDYPGLGGSEYLETEDTLRRFADAIDLRELAINGKELRQCFLNKIREQINEPGHGLTESEENKFKLSELEGQLKIAREMLLEFLTKCYYEEEWGMARIHFDDPTVLKDNWEIDVLAADKSKKLVMVAECSTNLPISDVASFAKEIEEKAKRVQGSKDYVGFELIRLVVTSKEALGRLRQPQKIIQHLEASGIRVLTIDDDILPQLRGRYRKDQVRRVFGHGNKSIEENLGHL